MHSFQKDTDTNTGTGLSDGETRSIFGAFDDSMLHSFDRLGSRKSIITEHAASVKLSGGGLGLPEMCSGKCDSYTHTHVS